jgi:DNA-directed RNA polymerase specialized sigma24 family protein
MIAKGRSSRGKPRPSAQGDNHYLRKRGLSMRGDSNPSAKLSRELVEKIRSEYGPRGVGGRSAAEIARDLGLHPSTVSKAISGARWRD